MTRIDGHGTVTLPPEYVPDHVQLGYAATEPGNQSDTATRSITLATAATTCRGLYVAATRGQDENLILVVTDSHDLARRRRHPRTHPRHRPRRPPPPPAVSSPPPSRRAGARTRCEIPDWFHDLHHDAGAALARARARDEHEAGADTRQQRISELTRQLQHLAPHCTPHEQAIAAVNKDLEHARRHHRHAERDLAESGYFGRGAARIEVAEAAEQVTAAETALAELTRRAQPLLDRRAQLTADP